MSTRPPSEATIKRLRILRERADLILSKDPDDPEGLQAQEQYLKLLMDYSLDEAAIAAGDDHTDQPVTSVRYAHPGRTWAAKRSHLIHMVCTVFELPHHTLALRDAPQWEMLICGTEQAIDTAVAICEYLLPQLEQFIVAVAASDHYRTLRGHARRSFASDAIDSWIGRVGGRVATLYAQAKQEHHEADTNARALVLADEFSKAVALLDQRVQQMETELGLQKGNAMPALRARSETAYRMGTDAGDRVDIGQTRMGDTPNARAALRGPE